MSLNITFETDQNLPRTSSLPTIISTVDIEALSELLEHSWQYNLSGDVVKILEIYFVQKCIFYDQK